MDSYKQFVYQMSTLKESLSGLSKICKQLSNKKKEK